jgi:signal transduction histidine kinase
MMRPRHIWLVFGLCFLVLLTAMGWVSWTTLRLDDAQRRAAQLAEQEEQVRLALWRMDSSLAPLFLEETARPYQHYEAFPTVSRAYKKGGSSYAEGDVLTPSPLLTYRPAHVLLHFQFAPGSPIASPQVPPSAQRGLAERNYTTSENLELATQRLAQLTQLLEGSGSVPIQTPSSTSTTFSSVRAPASAPVNNLNLLMLKASLATNPAPAAAAWPTPPNAQAGVQSKQVIQTAQEQVSRSAAELNARANLYQQSQNRVQLANDAGNSGLGNTLNPAANRLKEGLFAPVWLGRELMLVRRVELGQDTSKQLAGNRTVFQGCWLNWPELKRSLLTGVSDLFPEGDLEPAESNGGGLLARTLAAIPARFSPGPVPIAAVLPVWSPIRFSLVLAWSCVLLAGAAVAVLLHGTVSLSERRAAFVSAVTHELRTPLTTFKMYSEMLAADMVSDQQKRRQYLETLCGEANRLGHLVENVLAYARLERGSARQRLEPVPLQQLVQRVKERLEQRAHHAGATFVAELTPAASTAVVHADVSAVEQILFNLVDNACKYGVQEADNKVLRLKADVHQGKATLSVRDYGPGIPTGETKRLFEPFHKSADEAAHSAPGVGLGLALCRRLSRAMGGELVFDRSTTPGACFVLTLPLRG